MINRSLIRQKVVQLLYAHLIGRSDFKILMSPQRSTKESEESFEVYILILSLLTEITGLNNSVTSDTANDIIHVGNNSLIRALSNHSQIKTLTKNCKFLPDFISHILKSFCYEIECSSIYKDYKRKRNHSIEDEIKLWTTVIESILLPLLEESLKAGFGYSRKSIENGIHIAIDTINSYGDVRLMQIEAGNHLKASLDKAYELYISLLVLAIELTLERNRQIEAGKNKYLPTAEDLNPSTKFIDNKLIKTLRENEEVKEYLKNNPVSWDTEPSLLKNLLSEITTSDIYSNYMKSNISDYSEDCELWIRLFSSLIFQSDYLIEALESKNIYWNDDLHITGTFVIKSLKHALKCHHEGKRFNLLPMYKDEEDREFGKRLFMETLKHKQEYKNYIDKFVKSNWDPERIAFMDVVIMLAAITELIHFPLIPLPVTMNEYTEIAADYSTSKSGQFVNGLLYAVSEELKKEGKIFK